MQKRTVVAFGYGYGLVLAFVAVTAGLIFAHGGSVLNLAYPVMATVVAIMLFLYRRSVYVSFVWWIWLFTPEVRRFVDYQTSYHSISPVMLAPLTVTLISAIYLVRKPRLLLRREISPFSLYGLVLFYGLVIGILVNGPVAAIYDFLSWMAPLIFAVYLFLDTGSFAENRAAFVLSNLIGLIGTAGYGLYQFFRFPAWDLFWLTNSNLHSLGAGVAEEVRLFGPLNAPLPYGIALMIPLVLVLVTKGPTRIVGSFLGVPAFGLSSVRIAWLGWAIAALYLVARLGGKSRIRIVLLAVVVGLLAFPIVTVGPISDLISKRITTFSNLQQDKSLGYRINLYQKTGTIILENPLGNGLGFNSLAAKLSSSGSIGFDSGILQIPLVFGWAGGSLLIWCFISITIKILSIPRSRMDNISLAAVGIFFGMLLQPLGELSFSGFLGLATWVSAAIAYRGKV